jgi:hypothetical protein
MIKIIDVQHDKRIDCTSVLARTTVGEYLHLVSDVYAKRGGLDGQRPALKTKTAQSIRHRMIDDLSRGAVIPPIVVGILAPDGPAKFAAALTPDDDLLAYVTSLEQDSISIIDGMQRTTALMEAVSNSDGVGDLPLRVEFWVSSQLSSLVYRMLVLNSGQIPWEIGRQLETIYSQLLSILRSNVGSDVEIYARDDNRRRSDPGQFQAATIIRLFLAFTARRTEFDLRDRVAEDFARLDAIEWSSNAESVEYFVRTFRLLVLLDQAFSRAPQAPKPHQVRIADGSEIFQSEPALIGFIVAVAIHLFDLPGFQTDWPSVERKMGKIEDQIITFSKRLSNRPPDEVEAFLELDLLNQRLNQRSGQVGRFERELFLRAFQNLIEHANRLEDMKPCWLA